MRYLVATIYPNLGVYALLCSEYMQVGEQFKKHRR